MIYVECDNDSRFMKYLEFTYEIDYLHPGGKGNVLRDLKNADVSLGLIDSDPHASNAYPQLSDFDEIDSVHNLRLLGHNAIDTRKIIEIPDNIEEWWFRLGQLEGLDLNNFSVLNGFGLVKKDFSANDENHLYEYLDAISNQQSFLMMIEWINRYK